MKISSLRKNILFSVEVLILLGFQRRIKYLGGEVKRYFGFALADSMFAGNCNVTRREIPVEAVQVLVEQGVESCLNPSHAATIAAMRERFGIDVAIPETPPRVVLGPGDSVVVMGVRGLPRLTDHHEYTTEEIAKATFTFAIYTIVWPEP